VVTPSHEDNRLVAECQAGDLEAFNKLVLKYQDRVFDTIYRMVGHHEDARDLAQDCFVKAYVALSDFRGQSSFYTWLFRIAINCALSRRRWTARREERVVSHYEYPEDLGAAAADQAAAEPGLFVEQEEERRTVIEALCRLSPEHRAVIVLKDIEGADYAQMAEVLQCPRGTVKSRVHRARQALRKELVRLIQA
jgi:RNA polymerase sigma-70 factor (ECF subfamily)